jgi:DDE superfamily endonuclease
MMVPQTLLACLCTFDPCFTAPSFARFVTLMSGWMLCIGKHTVTGVMRAGGVADRDASGYHRFFSRGAWLPAEVGRVVLQLVLRLVPRDERVKLTLDDTLARHTGKHIASAGMHRDPLLSTGAKPFFHFGHNWLVLAVAVTLPWGKTFSLPCLVQLYRTAKTAQRHGLLHVKRTVVAAQMLADLAKYEQKRRFLVFADNAFVNRSIIRELPDGFDLVGRGRMDAALYAPPPTYRGAGRPRVKGKRLHSPEHRARKGRWHKLDVLVYGRPAQVRVQVFDALWYIVGGSRTMRFVLVRDWPGHAKDDVLVCTDLTLSAKDIIEGYCERWSLEETFGWVKSRLGFEDPHNRTEHAVHRTAPMALWAYSIVIVWYAGWARNRKTLPFRQASWYRTKAAPSFADMLATLRRQCWTIWVSDQAKRTRLDQKSLAPLLDVIGYG